MNRPDRLLLGLIGAGIQASRTPRMHEREAAAHGIACLYQLIDLELLGLDGSALPDLIQAAERLGFDGLNITHPSKQSVLPLLDEISDAARTLGAVNTVVLSGGRRLGHNTDYAGFAASFRDNLPGAALNHIVQLGAGGAGSATAYAALSLGARRITLFDPDEPRALRLCEALNRRFGSARITPGRDLSAALAACDGLIHATPTGMAAYPGLPLPAELLRPEHWLAEVVYFPIETELLRLARARGCRTLDGCGMAIGQAVEAFRHFTGREPDAARMAATFAGFTSTVA